MLPLEGDGEQNKMAQLQNYHGWVSLKGNQTISTLPDSEETAVGIWQFLRVLLRREHEIRTIPPLSGKFWICSSSWWYWNEAELCLNLCWRETAISQPRVAAVEVQEGWDDPHQNSASLGNGKVLGTWNQWFKLKNYLKKRGKKL